MEDQLTKKLAQYQDDRNFRKQSEMTRVQSVNNTANVVNAIQNNSTSVKKETIDESALSRNESTQDVVFCPHCGTKLKAEVQFCTKCGTKLS